jgi:hypothetical protein
VPRRPPSRPCCRFRRCPRAARPAGRSRGNCGSARQCLLQTLGAAAGKTPPPCSPWRPASRSWASRRRATGPSRKLNTEGLEALKAEDRPAAELFRKGLAENPRDVELAGNLGYALVKAGKPQEAAEC